MVVLIPLLWVVWNNDACGLPALVLAIFATVMVVVNSWIAAMGMGVNSAGWITCSWPVEVALTVFFLIAPVSEPITEP